MTAKEKEKEKETSKTQKEIEAPWPDDPDALEEAKPSQPVKTAPDLVTSDTFKALGKAAVEMEAKAKAERRTADGSKVLNIQILADYAAARDKSTERDKDGNKVVKGDTEEYVKELLNRTGPLVLEGVQYLVDGPKDKPEKQKIIVRGKEEIDRIRREQNRPVEDLDDQGRRRARA